MTTITIPLTDVRLQQLRDKAARLGISIEELARISLEGALSRDTEAFDEAVDALLKKNAELYRRLA